ncbi:hypothetical protein PMEGAPL128_58060 [Priestia megaterium]
MKLFAINGRPRKNKNTATLLDYALQGAAINEDTWLIITY